MSFIENLKEKQQNARKEKEKQEQILRERQLERQRNKMKILQKNKEIVDTIDNFTFQVTNVNTGLINGHEDWYEKQQIYEINEEKPFVFRKHGRGEISARNISIATLGVASQMRKQIDNLTATNQMLFDMIVAQNELICSNQSKLDELLNIVKYQPGTGTEFKKAEKDFEQKSEKNAEH